ncbi:hypothetical protein ACFL41_00425 [Gemmatimonadota bacterium]
MKLYQSGILLVSSILMLTVTSPVSAQSPRFAIQTGYNYASQTGEFAKSFGDDEGPVSEDIGSSVFVILRITKQWSLFREFAVDVQYRPPGQPPDEPYRRLGQQITWIGFSGSISLALVKK